MEVKFYKIIVSTNGRGGHPPPPLQPAPPGPPRKELLATPKTCPPGLPTRRVSGGAIAPGLLAKWEAGWYCLPMTCARREAGSCYPPPGPCQLAKRETRSSCPPPACQQGGCQGGACAMMGGHGPMTTRPWVSPMWPWDSFSSHFLLATQQPQYSFFMRRTWLAHGMFSFYSFFPFFFIQLFL
jgi:hypothetical protein